MLSARFNHRHQFTLLLTVIVCLGAFPLDVILPSVPNLASTFSVSSSEIAASISAFAVVAALAQLVFGPLSDRWGRKRLLIAGMVTSIGGALGCALSRDIEGFTFFRAVQAVGCGSFVLAHALTQDLLHEQGRVAMRIYLTTAGGVLIAVSPLAGSLLQSVLNWPGSFYVFMALSSVAIYMAYTLLPPDQPKRPSTDIFRQYLIVSSDSPFIGLSLIAAFAFACHFSFIITSPLILIDRLGLTNYEFSLILLIYGVAYGVGGAAARWLSSRVRPIEQLSAGLGLILLSGIFLLGITGTSSASTLGILIPMIICTAGATITRPIAFTLAMSRHPEAAGAAAATANSVLFLAGGGVSAGMALFENHLPLSLGVTFTVLGLLGFVLLTVYARRPGSPC